MDGLLFSSTTGPERPKHETRVTPRASRGERRATANGDAARQRVRQKKAKRLKRDAADPIKRTPVRTCVGCGTTEDAQELLRVGFAPADVDSAPSARLLIDVHAKRSALGNTNAGRGAWVHARPTCIQAACARGFSRAFKENLQLPARDFYRRLKEVSERQLEGLVLAAWRSRRLVYGGDAVKEALPTASLAILAADARSVAKETYVQEAARRGQMSIWSTKVQLGKWLGRSEVGVLAVMDEAIAVAMKRAIALSTLAGSEMNETKTDGSEPAVIAAAVEADAETPGGDALREDESSEVR